MTDEAIETGGCAPPVMVPKDEPPPCGYCGNPEARHAGQDHAFVQVGGQQ